MFQFSQSMPQQKARSIAPTADMRNQQYVRHILQTTVQLFNGNLFSIVSK